ncbi:unnamed protein product [Urochloa decumbens]|uniref:Uncharacterized protein n=1 Tax=Urochloa decumbens TaxID=240449 RepID=A0ABC9AR51_9POAL
MSNEGDVPGYFVGRPTNHTPERKEEPVAAAGNHTPGDYFIGRPETHHKQEQQESAQKPATKQSTPSFLAKCCPCLAGGGVAE